jgi:hypothetical protein
MKFFKSMFLLLALMLVAIPAFAQDANPCSNIPEATRGKNADSVSTILDLCRKASAKPALSIANTAIPEAEEVSEWSQAARGFAEAIGVAAKGLGIAVNEFMASPAGILLALILVLKYAGGVVIGIPFVVFTILVFTYLVRRLSISSIAYENVPMFWGMITVRRKTLVKTGSVDGETAGVIAITGIALLILDLIVCLNV